MRILVVFIFAFTASASLSKAGDFAFNWGTTHNWPANSTGPLTFTLSDEFGFDVDVRLSINRIGGVAFAGTPDDLLTFAGNQFGLETSIWLVWDANNGSSGIGEATNTATLEVLSGGVPFSSGVLQFNVSDLDSVDNNGITDRCDFITATGNAGNPALTYVSPTAATRSVQIGPVTGSGVTGAIAANQAQCIYNVGATTSNTSNGDSNGTILVTYPAGSHTATIAFDESIENVYGVTSRNAAARGVGVWGATLFSVGSQALTLEKTTSSTGYAGAGEVLNYTYTITNDGPLPINTGQNIQIQDDKIGTFTCGTITADIPVGGKHTCTNTYTTVAADASAANVTNNAIAGVGTGTQSFAARLQSNSDSAVVPRRPTITLTKITTGGTGSFTFTGNNGWASQTVTTTAAGGAGTAGTTQTLTAASTATTITETIPIGWKMTGVTCLGTGDGTQPTVNLTAGTIAFSTAQTVSGSNIACTVTNTRDTDYSDAPSRYGGASQSIVAGVSIGATVTADTADYNDPNAAGDADDGVAFPSMVQGEVVIIPVLVTGVGTLNAWIDYDANGSFDVGEQISVLAVDGGSGDSDGTVNGVIQLQVTIPTSAVTSQTFARFRYSNANPGPTGSGANGEVEDYALTVTAGTPALTIVKSFSLAKGPGNTGAGAEAGDTIVYTYVVTNSGNQTIVDVEVDDSGHTGQGPWVDPTHAGSITTDNGITGDSPDGNSDATIWGTLAPLDVVTFSSDYVVTQADIDGQM